MEEEHEEHGHDEGISGEDEPGSAPAFNLFDALGAREDVVVYNGLGAERSDSGAYVIIMNSPCAEERISTEVCLSTYSEPETLKKSKATP